MSFLILRKKYNFNYCILEQKHILIFNYIGKGKTIPVTGLEEA
jgi:hypothetical protein